MLRKNLAVDPLNLPEPKQPDNAVLRICPKCARQYGDGSKFCPKDGAELKAVDDRPGSGAQRGDIAGRIVGSSPRKFCPECGKEFIGDEQFCNVDGAKLENFSTSMESSEQRNKRKYQEWMHQNARQMSERKLSLQILNSTGKFSVRDEIRKFQEEKKIPKFAVALSEYLKLHPEKERYVR